MDIGSCAPCGLLRVWEDDSSVTWEQIMREDKAVGSRAL